MAFQSTKQRYEYIYGSSVRKLEAEPVREPQPVREPRPVREARPARQPQRRVVVQQRPQVRGAAFHLKNGVVFQSGGV